jgi:hypothetical protein
MQLAEPSTVGIDDAIKSASLPSDIASRPMAIIEPVVAAEALSQGDVLRGIALYATDLATSTDVKPQKIQGRYCLVLTRPCGVSHKDSIVVAAIEKYKPSIPSDIKSMQDVVDFLTELRDGTDSPDKFYLGELPGEKGRFCAVFDSLHTFKLPNDRSSIVAQRIGRLSAAFARDLHLRLHRAYASLGFDDIAWFSTEDLDWIVNKGREELQAKKAAQSKLQFAGGAMPEGSIEDAERTLQPYIDELERRSAEPQ